MKRFAIITGSILLLSLAACANTDTTTAPGAVSGKSSACCKDNKAATCDKTATPAAASPGAVSGEKKSGCGACPMSGAATGCPMSGKTNG